MLNGLIFMSPWNVQKYKNKGHTFFQNLKACELLFPLMESRFLKPPRETKIASRKQDFVKLGVKLQTFIQSKWLLVCKIKNFEKLVGSRNPLRGCNPLKTVVLRFFLTPLWQGSAVCLFPFGDWGDFAVIVGEHDMLPCSAQGLHRAAQ